MKELSKAEHELLMQKNQQLQLAQIGFNEFVTFLKKQHDCEGWNLSKDGKYFEEPPKEAK